MAADPVFRDEVMELLAPVGTVTSRSMFGGYGILAEGDLNVVPYLVGVVDDGSVGGGGWLQQLQ